jgi:hypothetical protein
MTGSDGGGGSILSQDVNKPVNKQAKKIGINFFMMF